MTVRDQMVQERYKNKDVQPRMAWRLIAEWNEHYRKSIKTVIEELYYWDDLSNN